MKAFFYFLIINVCIANFCLAQNPTWHKIETEVPQLSVGAMTINENTGRIYIAVDNWIYYSDDQGTNWSQVLTTTTYTGTIMTLDVDESNNRLYVGSDQVGVLWTDNNGLSWGNEYITHNSLTGFGEFIGTIAIKQNPHIVFAGLYRSTNSGTSFQKNDLNNTISGSLGSLKYVFTKNGDVWLLQNDSFFSPSPTDGLYRSTDNGITWIQTPLDTILNTHTIESMDVDTTDNIYLATWQGIFKIDTRNNVIINTDNGLPPLNPVTENSKSVYVDKTNNVIYIIRNGSVYKSADNGNSWILLPSINNKIMVCAYNNNVYTISAINGFHRKLGNSNWEFRNIIPNYDINQFKIATNGTYYVNTGNSGHFFKSIDQGVSWTPLILASDYLIKDTTIYAVGYDGVYKSLDDGNTWININYNEPAIHGVGKLLCTTNALVFYNGTGSVYQLNFSTQTWTLVYFNNQTWNWSNSVQTTSGRIIIGFTSFTNGLIYSDDQGETWTEVFFNVDVNPIQRLSVSNWGEIFYTSQNKVFKSTDDGLTWNEVYTLNLPELTSTMVSDNLNNIYLSEYAGTQTTIGDGYVLKANVDFSTIDTLNTNYPIEPALAQLPARKAIMNNFFIDQTTNTLYANSKFGIYYYGTDLSTKRANILTTSTNSFNVYPNPANEKVTINLDADITAVLRLYDSVGNEINTTRLVNGKVELAIQNLANGVYSIQIVAQGATTIKKLVVMH